MAHDPDKHWLDPPEWWKKWKPLRWLAAAGVLSVGLSSFWGTRILLEQQAEHAETARYLQVEPGVAFLNGLSSYDRIDSVVARLTAAGARLTTQANHKPASHKYPPRNLDSINATGVEHLHTRGTLQLEFFNDRLFEATFIPESISPYNKLLHAAYAQLKRDRLGKSEWISGPLRIASNVDLVVSPVGVAIQAEPYVIWQDLRLMQQRQEWESSYAAIALRP